MPKLRSETYQDYRDRVLNPISPSFCGAKWLNATVWLGSGNTASCHHPPAHKIPLEEIAVDYKALHNTEFKKRVRAQMLAGEFPTECDYCWKVEGMGSQYVSDRVYKSIIYTDSELQELADSVKDTENVNPKTLEIAFDAMCNFACSYCNSSFSTSWSADIKTNGHYTNLISDGGSAFQHDGSWDQPYGLKNENNPYVAAFMEWWEKELSRELVELRITGGEATMSPDFWRLMSWWDNNPDCKVKLAVNSNLGAKKSLLEKLCATTHKMNEFILYTSNESFGTHAEYIRDGLIWDEWLNNLEFMLDNGKISKSNVMMTINSLCLYSITDLMDTLLKMKAKYGSNHLMMSFNILRFPSFQAPVTLPKEFREERANHIENWLKHNWDMQPVSITGRGMLAQFEYDGLVRLISYLREVDVGHDNTSSLESRQSDFKSFFMQYDARRNKNFVETFPQLKEWYESIKVIKTIPIIQS